MYFKILLMFIIISVPGLARAQDDVRYRVEVLVLEHLQHDAAPRATLALRDYSAALDFSAPAPAVNPACSDADDPEPQEPLPGPLGDMPDPNAPVALDEMGPEMSDAWRRLRLSAAFRPLQYLAWEQSDTEPFPVLRIHGDQPLWTDDPRERIESLAPADELIDMTAGSPGERYEQREQPLFLPPCPLFELPTVWPGPVTYFALDGTVSLRRSRFLHLDLDLQKRSPAAGPLAVQHDGKAGAPALPGMPLMQVHELLQSRQVRSGRMEYFDGPVISALAWITAIPLADPEERL